MQSTLKVRVYDKDTLSDDILGEYDVNLNLQNLVKEDAESEVTRKARMVAPDTLWLRLLQRLTFENAHAGARGI